MQKISYNEPDHWETAALSHNYQVRDIQEAMVGIVMVRQAHDQHGQLTGEFDMIMHEGWMISNTTLQN